MTREEIIADLKLKNPVMKSGNDTDGYIEYTPEQYEAQIQSWADYVEQEQINKLKQEKELTERAARKAAAEAKLAALGLTADDLKALGL